MLYFLFYRVWAHTLFYFLIAYPLWSVRNAGGIYNTLAYGLLAVLTTFYVKFLTTKINEERKIDALGKHTYKVPDYSPFGLWTVCRAVYLFSNWRNHEFWFAKFSKDWRHFERKTTEAIISGQRIIFTVDEENIKAILATQFQDYGKGPEFNKSWKDFLGQSIFTTDGDAWHNSRSLLRPQFIKDRVADLKTFEKHVQVLLPLLAGTNNGATVRVDDLFYRYSLDAATDFLLGKSVDSLSNSETEFADAFGEVQRVQSLFVRAGPLQFAISKKSFYKALKALNNFVNQYIDQALALPQDDLEKLTKSDEGYTFLHALVSYTRDREVLRDQIVAILLAGRDTTAVTLSWMFYELSQRPEIVAKLRKEIFDTVGAHRHPTYSDLKNMRYLQHVLNETMRLYPVLPYNVRSALQDTTLPRGGGPNGDEPISVLKDTEIGYSTFVMQRRSDIYPSTSEGFPDYLDFVPERWETWTPRPWTFIPFNGGPRICIGQQYALTQLSYTLVRVLQTFSRLECRQDEFPEFRSDIVLQPAKGVHAAFFKDQS